MSWIVLETLTFLSIGNAAVAFSKHTAEPTDTLCVSATILAFSSQRHTETKVTITGETPTTHSVMVAQGLMENNGCCNEKFKLQTTEFLKIVE